MAENDSESILEDVSSGEEGSEVTKKALSTKMILIIAIGLLTTLLIGLGAYLFLVPKDTDDTVEQVELGADSSELGSTSTEINGDTPVTTSLSLEAREQIVTLKEEILLLKQQISELKTPNDNSTAEMSESSESSEPSESSETSDSQKTSPKSQFNTEQYSDQYQQDSQLRPTQNTDSVPKPKWGEFEHQKK